jgi:hypothetical protein
MWCQLNLVHLPRLFHGAAGRILSAALLQVWLAWDQVEAVVRLLCAGVCGWTGWPVMCMNGPAARRQ